MFKRKQTGDEGRNLKLALEDGEKSGFQRNRYKGPVVCLLERDALSLKSSTLNLTVKATVAYFFGTGKTAKIRLTAAFNGCLIYRCLFLCALPLG